MARLVFVDDHSSSAQRAADYLLSRNAADVVAAEQASFYRTDSTATLVAPSRNVGEPLWKTVTAGYRIGYGRAEEMERCLMLGGADYLCEPWTVTELVIRTYQIAAGVRAFLGRVMELNGKTVVLSHSQQLLWEELFRRRGEVVSRELLLAGKRVSSRALDMSISRLRHLLEPAGYTIEGVRGRGFRLCQKIEKSSNSIVDK